MIVGSPTPGMQIADSLRGISLFAEHAQSQHIILQTKPFFCNSEEDQISFKKKCLDSIRDAFRSLRRMAKNAE